MATPLQDLRRHMLELCHVPCCALYLGLKTQTEKLEPCYCVCRQLADRLSASSF